MAIVVATHTTEIRIGQFVCAGRSVSLGTCTGPRQITDIRGSRLHFELEGKPTHMLRQSALFVCDTAAEGEAMFEYLYRREVAREKAMQAASASVTDEYRAGLVAMLQNSPTTTGA